MTETMTRRLAAEGLGTFWLVFGGCGSAIFAGEVIGAYGVALAFGLTVVTGAYAFGPISGGHFNPAVTVGLAVGKRFDWKDVPGYAIAQVIGGLVAGVLLWIVAIGLDGFEAKNNFAANGFGDFSPAGYNLLSVLVIEVLLTAVFLLVILGATAKRASAAFGGLTIGLTLTLIHLISIPVSNTSVNPARSIAVAPFAGGDAMLQLWVFIVAPILGAIIAGVVYTALFSDED